MKPAKPPYDHPKWYERRWREDPEDWKDWLLLGCFAVIGAILLYFAFHK